MSPRSGAPPSRWALTRAGAQAAPSLRLPFLGFLGPFRSCLGRGGEGRGAVNRREVLRHWPRCCVCGIRNETETVASKIAPRKCKASSAPQQQQQAGPPPALRSGAFLSRGNNAEMSGIVTCPRPANPDTAATLIFTGGRNATRPAPGPSLAETSPRLRWRFIHSLPL